ncbi:MAG TPA: hypothetical protein VKA70_18275 [Blastocatellia bacterium]|nr:hypothetical protein [Blastocatellia bacterium]
MTPESFDLSTKTLELSPGPFGDLLVSPYEIDYGTRGGEISVNDLTIRLGDRPVCRNLQKLYELSHKELPADVVVFDAYDIWLVTHVIGAIRRPDSSARLKALGYEAVFDEPENIYTIDIAPRSKFVHSLEGKAENTFDLGLDGHAQLPGAIKTWLETVDYIGGDAKIRLSTDLKVIGRVSFSLISPLIQALGLGSSRCEWLYELDPQDLLTDQVMLQTVLVPKGTRSIKFRARGYAHIKPKWISFPALFQTRWLDLECALV